MSNMHPLRIELVPKTSFFSNLRSELTQSQWDKIRKTIYEKSNHKCEICAGKGRKHPVECHEKWEYDVATGVQKLIGLESLCPACHKVKHIGYALSTGRGKSAIKHMMKVNKISEDEAWLAIDEAFLEWEYRSQFNWRLDLSLLSALI